MRFLVTGGAGYIGSHMSHKLIEAGHQVTVIDNLSTGFKELIPAQAQFIQADISDQKTIYEILSQGFDAIFHFAAFVRVEESVENPGKYYENNTAKALSLLQVSSQFPKTAFIFSSTAAVYGASEGMVSETSPVNPLNAYGHSKLMTEQILKEMSLRHGFKAVVLRYFNVAGSHFQGKTGQRSKNSTHLIKVAAEAACGKREKVSIFGTHYQTPDGTCIRDFIHIEDLCEAHLNALTYLNSGGKEFIFNLGYGQGYSVRQALSAMQKISKNNFKIAEEAPRPGDTIVSIANSERAKRVLEWKPKYNNLDLICESAFNYEKSL